MAESLNAVQCKNSAVIEWQKTHKLGEGWRPVTGFFLNGDPLVLLEKDDEEYGYSVQYRGNGHYFKEASEAYMYMANRLGEQKERRPSIVSKLIKGLENAPSYVTKDGEWKYDRVDSGLVTALLDYLHSVEV